MVYSGAMKRRPAQTDWLPMLRGTCTSAIEPSGEGFQTGWIDFRRGIRVGHLQPHQRITQILKFLLQRSYGAEFLIDRWGRGVYWQWICWLPRANRRAKPLSGGVNFGCAKLFISVDRTGRVFQAGLQVERGQVSGSAYPGTILQEDWDWHRLLKQSRRGSRLDAELRRLILEEQFVVEIGDFSRNIRLDRGNYGSAAGLRQAARKIAPGRFGGFQLYYPMPEAELRGCSGLELVNSVLAVFAEVVPVMNLCMQVPLSPRYSQGPSIEAR
jgi:hypothetical protein